MSLIPHPTSLSHRLLKNKKKSVSAFTFIELLVVIGVLGILVILVVQSLGDAKTTSIESQVRANLRNLNQASYRAFLVGDNNRPDITWTNVSPNPLNPGSAVQWYINNGYISLSEFDPAILDYIEIGVGTDGPNIWKRKP